MIINGQKIFTELLKLKVREITVATVDKKESVANQKPLLLIKAIPQGVNKMQDLQNNQNQQNANQPQVQNQPPPAQNVPQYTPEQIKQINEQNLRNLESQTSQTTHNDEKGNAFGSEVTQNNQQLNNLSEAVNNLSAALNKPPQPHPQAQQNQNQPLSAQNQEKQIQPGQPQNNMQNNTFVPLQTQQAAEAAGIGQNNQTNQQQVQQNQPQVQNQQNTTPNINSQQIQQTNFQTPQNPPQRQSVDIFTTNQEQKTQKIREKYNEYKNDKTKNPWDLVQDVANM